jgi:DNA-binding NarL/FixJ family response regulator
LRRVAQYFHTALGLWLPEPKPLVLSAEVREKLTPELLRVVWHSAHGLTRDEIAELEDITPTTVDNRLRQVRKILKVYTTICAFRVLVFAGIIPLQ